LPTLEWWPERRGAALAGLVAQGVEHGQDECFVVVGKAAGAARKL
jgi:hypothetical protein